LFDAIHQVTNASIPSVALDKIGEVRIALGYRDASFAVFSRRHSVSLGEPPLRALSILLGVPTARHRRSFRKCADPTPPHSVFAGV
jgi:hypothetical protein